MDSIIFDVDGTLWDCTPLVAKSWTKVVQQEYDPEMVITSDTLHKEFGKTLPDIGKSLFSKVSTKRQLELIDKCTSTQHVDLLANPPATYPDLEKVLQILSAKLPLYIVSNCQAGYIEVFLQATGLGKYFEDHLCPGDTGNAKAANIKEIVQRHNLKSAVYVGDTMGDYIATKEAGLPFIFVTYGFGDVDSPDYSIDSLKELPALF